MRHFSSYLHMHHGDGEHKEEGKVRDVDEQVRGQVVSGQLCNTDVIVLFPGVNITTRQRRTHKTTVLHVIRDGTARDDDHGCCKQKVWNLFQLVILE